VLISKPDREEGLESFYSTTVRRWFTLQTFRYGDTRVNRVEIEKWVEKAGFPGSDGPLDPLRLRQQFNLDDANGVAAGVEGPDDFYVLVLVLLDVVLSIELVRGVTRHLQDIPATVIHDLPRE
jgi:hypothetical protein